MNMFCKSKDYLVNYCPRVFFVKVIVNFLSYFKISLPSASPLHLPSQIKFLKEQCLLHPLHYHLFIPNTHCVMVSDTISPKTLASPP